MRATKISQERQSGCSSSPHIYHKSVFPSPARRKMGSPWLHRRSGFKPGPSPMGSRFSASSRMPGSLDAGQPFARGSHIRQWTSALVYPLDRGQSIDEWTPLKAPLSRKLGMRKNAGIHLVNMICVKIDKSRGAWEPDYG